MTIHYIEPEAGITACCSRTPFELAPDQRIAYDQAEATCPGRSLSPDDMQRFEIYTLATGGRGEHLGISHIGCPEGWAAELEDYATLAELVQRAEEHTEVCR